MERARRLQNVQHRHLRELHHLVGHAGRRGRQTALRGRGSGRTGLRRSAGARRLPLGR